MVTPQTFPLSILRPPIKFQNQGNPKEPEKTFQAPVEKGGHTKKNDDMNNNG